MYRKYLIVIMLLFRFIVQISFADSVKFKSTSKGKDDKPVMLTGIFENQRAKVHLLLSYFYMVAVGFNILKAEVN